MQQGLGEADTRAKLIDPALSGPPFSGELTTKWREKNRTLAENEVAAQKKLLAAATSKGG